MDVSVPANLYDLGLGVPPPPAPPTKMSAPPRKYTAEQIRFVLTRWSDTDRELLAEQFNQTFDGEAVNKKHIKYLKDTYAKHPQYIEEFGHLMTDRQRARALQEEQAKEAKRQGTPAQEQVAKKPSPDGQSENMLPQGTPMPTGFPPVGQSAQPNANTNGQYQPVGGIVNATGLGINGMRNLSTGFPSPNTNGMSGNPLSQGNPAIFQNGLGTPMVSGALNINQWPNVPVTSAAGFLHAPTTTAAAILNTPAIFQNQAALSGGQNNPAASTMGPGNGNAFPQWPLQGSATTQARPFITGGPLSQPARQNAATHYDQISEMIAARAKTQPFQGAGMATAQQSMPTGALPRQIANYQQSMPSGSQHVQSAGIALGHQQFMYPGSPARPIQNIGVAQGQRFNGSASPSKRASVSPLGNPQTATQNGIALAQQYMAAGSPSPSKRPFLSGNNLQTIAAQNTGMATNQQFMPAASPSPFGRASVSPPNNLQMAVQNAARALNKQLMPAGSPSPSGTPVSSANLQSAAQNTAMAPAQQSVPAGSPSPFKRASASLPNNPQVAMQNTGMAQGQQFVPAGSRSPSKQPSISVPSNTQTATQNMGMAPGQQFVPAGSRSPSKRASVSPPNNPQAALQNMGMAPVQLVPASSVSPSKQASMTPNRLPMPKPQHLTLPRVPVQTSSSGTSVPAPPTRIQQAQNVQAQNVQTQNVQQGHLVQQVVHQQAQNVQQVPKVQQSQQARPTKRARVTAKAQQVKAVPPQQLNVAGISSIHNTNQGANPQAQALGAHRGPNTQLPRAEVWLGVDPHSPLPIPTPSREIIPGSANHYDTFPFEDLERLPNTINGDHFQHHLYNNFADFPWSVLEDFDTAPIVGGPQLENHQSQQESGGTTTTSDVNGNSRKRQAEDDLPATNADNAVETADPERATKRRNLGEGLSVTTSTTSNPRE